MKLSALVTTSRAVADTSSRLRKIDLLASFLASVPPGEIETAVALLTASPRQGRLRVGGAMLAQTRAVEPAGAPTLELTDIDVCFDRLAGASGTGSTEVRAGLLRDLFRRATYEEQDVLVRILFGELRQGALESVLVDAVARASDIEVGRVRRAAMLAGALAPVARAALVEKERGLSQFLLKPFQPVQPMLADSAADLADALTILGEAALEYKLDGARIQVHKVDDEVKVYSRNLRDVTVAVPEVVHVVGATGAREIILDGEAIALRPDRTPHPFQTTMRRFGRTLDVDRVKKALPITPFFFDALYVDGTSLVDEPLTRRLGVVEDRLPKNHVVPRIVTADAEQAATFAARAQAEGHEGVMAKAVDGGIRVQVIDDGTGFVVAEAARVPGHIGLVAMRERAQLAGGWCRIESDPGTGTRVDFWVPMNL